MDWQKFQNRINFGITSYCNASCPLCERTIQIDNLKINHLSLKKILKNLQNLPTNMTTVILSGDFGDPLMHPDITDIIKMCNDHSKTVRIHTNGGLRNPEWFKHIGQKYPQTEIVFGIDGLDQSTNNSYRVGVDFDLAKANMFEYQKYCDKNKCVWQFIIFPWNKHQVSDLPNIIGNKNIFLHLIRNTRHPWNVSPEEEELKWTVKESIFTLRKKPISNG